MINTISIGIVAFVAWIGGRRRRCWRRLLAIAAAITTIVCGIGIGLTAAAIDVAIELFLNHLIDLLLCEMELC